MRHRRGIALVSFFCFATLAAAQLGASCVDGVTPDCSNGSQCAPILTLPEAGGDGSSAPEASTPDAASDARAEAGDAARPSDAADGG